MLCFSIARCVKKEGKGGRKERDKKGRNDDGQWRQSRYSCAALNSQSVSPEPSRWVHRRGRYHRRLLCFPTSFSYRRLRYRSTVPVLLKTGTRCARSRVHRDTCSRADRTSCCHRRNRSLRKRVRDALRCISRLASGVRQSFFKGVSWNWERVPCQCKNQCVLILLLFLEKRDFKKHF